MSRFKEPSTYAGIAAVLAGLGQIFKVNEAPYIADAVNQATPYIISNQWTGAVITFAGALAILLKEKSHGAGS